MNNPFVKSIALTVLAFAMTFSAAAGSDTQHRIVSQASCQESAYKHALLAALIKNDVRQVSRLLKSGEYDVNEVICVQADDKNALENYPRTFRLPSLTWKEAPAYLEDSAVISFEGYTGDYAAYETPKPVCRLYGTPLMIAAQKGSDNMLRVLLKNGANPNLVVKIGNRSSNTLITEGYQYLTAVSAAAFSNDRSPSHDKIVARTLATLKAAGARPGPRDGRGRSCLLDAVEYQSVPLFKFCQTCGIDPNASDYDNKTVFDHCRDAATMPSIYGGGRAWMSFLRKIAVHQRTAENDEEDDEEDEDEL